MWFMQLRSPLVLLPEQPEEQQRRLSSLRCLDGRPPLQTDSLPFRRNRFKTSQTNPPWALTGKGERLVIVGEYAGCLVVPIIIHHQLSTHVLNAPGFTTIFTIIYILVLFICQLLEISLQCEEVFVCVECFI